MLGDVGAPQLVRSLSSETALHQVVVHGRGWTMTSFPTVADALKAFGAHQASHSLSADPMASSQFQLGVDPRGPVGGPGVGMDLSDLVEEVRISPVTF
jgi:hypothetical protein